MIIRVMTEAQYRVDDGLLGPLNELDTEAEQALEAGDAERLGSLLEQMAQMVRDGGERLDDSDLSPSDLVIPPADLSLEEAKDLFSDGGLIPDLPEPE
jgi:PspA-Associated protein